MVRKVISIMVAVFCGLGIGNDGYDAGYESGAVGVRGFTDLFIVLQQERKKEGRRGGAGRGVLQVVQ
jgi:hypothetical protein